MKYLVLASLLVSHQYCSIQNITEDILKIAEDNNVTVKHSALGLYEVLSGATQEAGTLFDEFEEGFQQIQPLNDTEEFDLDINGTSIVLDLFNTVRGATKAVGGILGTLESNLEDNKDNIEDIAGNLEQNVGEIAENVGNDFSTFTSSLGTQVGGIGEDITSDFSTFTVNIGNQVAGIGDDITEKVDKKVVMKYYALPSKHVSISHR